MHVGHGNNRLMQLHHVKVSLILQPSIAHFTYGLEQPIIYRSPSFSTPSYNDDSALNITFQLKLILCRALITTCFPGDISPWKL